MDIEAKKHNYFRDICKPVPASNIRCGDKLLLYTMKAGTLSKTEVLSIDMNHTYLCIKVYEGSADFGMFTKRSPPLTWTYETEGYLYSWLTRYMVE